MVAETAKRFEALEAQAQVLTGVLTRAGYESVAPSMIQPADVFLDVVGEQLRARTYVFAAPDGAELCLRPDITVPTCLLYLERHPRADARARYCYNGPAFRYQAAGAGPAHPREFRQAGLECFGEAAKEKADAEVLALTLAAMKAAGLGPHAIRIGDVGLFHALMAEIDMPARWRRRLLHRFWRRDGFRAELKRLSTDPGSIARNLPIEIMSNLDAEDRAEALQVVEGYLDTREIDIVGTRTLDEITDRLLAAAHDARQPPLPAETTALISDFLSVAAPAKAAGARLKDLMRERAIDLAEALEAYHKRLQQLAANGVDCATLMFNADFGRNLEYYTGFVFEVANEQLGPQSPLAGGGRYDSLMRMVGAPQDVSAVGSAIHTERLLDIVGGTI
jgi:ATP phosphoribosyltransferase regulatory subunit